MEAEPVVGWNETSGVVVVVWGHVLERFGKVGKGSFGRGVVNEELLVPGWVSAGCAWCAGG